MSYLCQTTGIRGLGEAEQSVAPSEWVRTQLKAGDQLRVDSDPEHSLGHLYASFFPGMSPQQVAEAIVAGNGVKFPSGINEWVVATGGTMFPTFAAFTANSRINLPPGGPRSQTSKPVVPGTVVKREPPPNVKDAAGDAKPINPLLIAGIVGVGSIALLLLLMSRKKSPTALAPA